MFFFLFVLFGIILTFFRLASIQNRYFSSSLLYSVLELDDKSFEKIKKKKKKKENSVRKPNFETHDRTCLNAQHIFILSWARSVSLTYIHTYVHIVKFYVIRCLNDNFHAILAVRLMDTPHDLMSCWNNSKRVNISMALKCLFESVDS